MNKSPSIVALIRSRRKELTLLLVFACAIRVGVMIGLAENFQQDPDAYRALATSIREDGILGVIQPTKDVAVPTAYRPPLYPIVLSCLVGFGKATPWLIAGLHLGLACWTVLNTYALSLSWGVRRMAWLPGLLVAADPLLLNQSTLIMTETMAALMTTLCLLALNRWNSMPTTANSILVGSTFGIAILCRPTFIVWFALAGLASLATKFREFRAWPAMQIVVASLLVVLTPWIVRNQFTLYPPGSRSVWASRPVFATTHGGYTLLLGNNPSFYDHLDEPADGRDWPAENPTFQGEMRAIQFEAIEQYRIDHHELPPADNYLETYLDRVCYEHASDAIADRPTSFLWACALRITWLWTPLAHPTTDPEPVARKTLRFASALWFALIYLALGFGLIHWRTVPSNESSTAPAARSAADADAARQPTRLAHPWLYGILFCLALTVLHTFFWSNLRMRAPLIPILSLLAAYGLERFVDIWSPSKRSLPAAEIN